MKVLQICSYSSGYKFYGDLFDKLEKLGINSSVYVFTHEAKS